MKSLIYLLLLMSFKSYGVSVGHIWDGEQFSMDGYQIIQDGTTKSDFYWLPKKFKVKIKSTFDQNGDLIQKVMADHTI